jgi:hypothetical protein
MGHCSQQQQLLRQQQQQPTVAVQAARLLELFVGSACAPGVLGYLVNEWVYMMKLVAARCLGTRAGFL